MRVRMKLKIGGHRNGEEWPEAGGVLDLPDYEAVDLIGAGYADPAGKEPPDDQEAAGEADGEPAEDGGPEAAGEADGEPAERAKPARSSRRRAQS